MSRGLRVSLSSLQVPNFRRYFTGQVISLSGTWMQTVAESWLVLRLTGSGVALGFAAALQFTPILLAGPWGGLIADRTNKRRLLQLTQTCMALPALALWALTASGSVELWMVYLLILARGTVLAVDNPTRQSFVFEMVGREGVVNAVSLNMVLIQTARIAGPALAAIVIALAGVATCFLLNALSFGCMLLALARMDPRALHAGPPAERAPGQLRAGLRVVASTPALMVPLAMTAVVGTLAFNFQIVLPLLARVTFGGTVSTYALLTGSMGIGALIGALVNGARGRVSPQLLAGSAIAFGLGLALAAGAPDLALVMGALLLTGAASVTFTASAVASLQLAVDPAFRGRIMALYAVVFVGSTPIGGPLIGWISQDAGPRVGLAIGAVGAIAAGMAGLWWASRGRESGAPVPGITAS